MVGGKEEENAGGEGLQTAKAYCSSYSTMLLQLTVVSWKMSGCKHTCCPSRAEVGLYFMPVCEISSNSWLGRI